MDVPALMTELAKTRPIFHSEADFQHALAWLIQRAHSDAKIRLEKPFPGLTGGRARLDIWVKIGESVDVIELKYQTRKLWIEVGSEKFDLTNKGADDNLGYDFLSDLVRVERLAATLPNCTGHSILLSNEANWHKSGRAGEFNKDAFRIHEGREVAGTLSWRKKASSKERAAALELKGEYIAKWKDYHDFGGKAGKFRYLWLCTGGNTPMDPEQVS